MADSGGSDFDEHLTGSGASKINLINDERP
jgi:hypothetical protein